MDNQNDNLNQQQLDQQPMEQQQLDQQPTNSQELNQQSITQPTQQEPTVEIKNNKKSGKTIILILVLFTIIGGLTYYFLIKPKEETNQKKEENTTETETETTESDQTTNSNNQETSNTNNNTTKSKKIPVIDFEFAPSFDWNDKYDTVNINNHNITINKTTLKDIAPYFKWINTSLKEKAEVAKEYSGEKNPPKSINDKTKEIVYIKDLDILENSNTQVSIWDDSNKEKIVGNIPIYKISHINGEENVSFKGIISNTDTQKEVFNKLGNPTYASVVDNIDPSLVCEWETSNVINQKRIRVIFDGEGRIFAIEIEHKI
ncbi:MAG: hypothetical protein VZS44_08325 [Bacilli bacterium]|nr:hypothetical protein [Bacilli bacterium]